ncbi:PREDICTED: protein cortex isoform X1 [Drosophila arizonae]|uniref:Protein cortex isoform X1 n=1 Tax=Drosophila arizonae TaxID=7263 RepID=A0ABM1NUJ0_DROAR|nr:PREDICTED: protein cortex isoform X1 [Drosophila arizonae]
MLVFDMDVCESFNKNPLMDPNLAPPFMKQRRMDWRNEVYQNKQINNRQEFTFGDRFIPRRFKPEAINYNLKYVGKTKEQDLLQMSLTQRSSYWRQSNFVTTMNKVLNIEENRLLQFSDVQCKYSRTGRQKTDSDWFCKPRARPVAFATTTNEMPALCTTFDLNMMDWSVNDQMAVSFDENLIIWRNRDDTSMIFNVERTSSLKYSPNGKYLAIGCKDGENPVLEIWLLQSPKEFLVANGKYLPRSFESICCIEWSEDGEEILCGTMSGQIVVIQFSTMTIEHVLRQHTKRICCMRFSPMRRYLATADIQGQIYIFHGVSYKVIMRLGAKQGGIVFDWHPWQAAELAISEKKLSSIYIFNVPRREIVSFYQRGDDKILINSITFSKITGELLVNIYKCDENGCPCFEIFVLSSLNRVVDILTHYNRGAIFMMWSPDGTKLAAAGVDESFSIWEFYPSDKLNSLKHKQTRQLRKRSALELYGSIR